MNQGNRVWICGHEDDLNQEDVCCKMFDSLGVKAIICAARRGPYKLQDTFFKYNQTFGISNR